MSPLPPVVSAADRLSRLLALVPWLLANPGVAIADAARRFSITPELLVSDLELLFVCGTPGHAPDDLIEADWEDGFIHLGNADAIAKPLRLGLDEALALIAGLRTLLEVPGAGDRDVLTSALAKLSAAATDAASASAALSVDLTGSLGAGSFERPGATLTATVLERVREGLRRRVRLHLTYLVPSRDETTTRDVDPMRLLTVDGHWYLEGWCHLAAGVRLFRIDRVLGIDLLDVDGTPPEQAVARDVDDSLFQPSPDDTVVTLRLSPSVTWLIEHVPVLDVTDLRGGAQRVRLRTADDRWLRRLLLPLAGEAIIEDPPELARALAAAARAALAGYDLQPSGSTLPGTSAPTS